MHYDDSDFADAPLYGDGAAPVKPFRLVITHARDGRREEAFRAFAEADAGSLIAMQRARNPIEQASAAAGLIFAAMVDDDGLSADYEPPEDTDEAAARREEIETRLTEIGNEENADADEVRDLNAELADLTPDEVDPRLEDRTQWSSKRRFEDVMNDPQQRVRPDALAKLSELIIGTVAGRPTPKSGSSSRGPGTKRRG